MTDTNSHHDESSEGSALDDFHGDRVVQCDGETADTPVAVDTPQSKAIAALNDMWEPKTIDDIAWPIADRDRLKRFVAANNSNLLIVGPTGIGKTTTARIVAAATKRNLNMTHGNRVNGEDRKLMRDFGRGRVDVFGDNKISIIDEADKLMKSQVEIFTGNTMDEVMHVFTGIHPSKFPDDLRSRCECFIFTADKMQALKNAQLDRLRGMINHAGADIDSGVLQSIVETAGGDLRQCRRLIEEYLAPGGAERFNALIDDEDGVQDEKFAGSNEGGNNSAGSAGVPVMPPLSVPEGELSPITSDLLNDICTLYGRFLVVEPEAIKTMALWVMHCHLHPVATHSPILGFISPQQNCGKSTALEMLARSLIDASLTTDFTKAALYAVAAGGFPILLDEVDDKDIVDGKSLTRFLNGGIKRNGTSRLTATAIPYDNWCPKVIAKIGSIKTQAVASRVITIFLHRALPGQKYEMLGPQSYADFKKIGVRLTVWAQYAEATFVSSDPAIPSVFTTRRADLYRGLFAIADIAGGLWSAEARDAALLIETPAIASQNLKPELLPDIFEIRQRSTSSGIFSADLVMELKALAHRPWGSINESLLAGHLAGYGVGPKNVRIGLKQRKGYKWSELDPLFPRYVPGAASSAPVASGPVHADVGISPPISPAIPESVVADSDEGTAGTAGTADLQEAIGEAESDRGAE